ncbi:MAG TPA: hypothetical protein VLS48_03480, partial [Anaerolineales bacterium]|nr:hypothetical protein [Anaerolineales bacterium]
MKAEHAWRYSLLGALFAVVPFLIIVQIIRIQVNPEQVKIFLEQGDYYAGETHTLTPTRGQIYDRWGHLLAGNTTVYEVGVELYRVRNPQTIALTLNVVLGLDYATTFRAASQEPSQDAVYAVLTN